MTSTISVEAEILLLWEREAPGLRLYFRRALNDPDTAEDLTAESFAQLAAAYNRGGVTNGEAVLRRIAQRRLQDEIRRRRDGEIPAGLLLEEPDTLDLPLGEPLTPEIDEFRSNFDRALRDLEEPERDAFILTELRGLSDHEAASVLGISQPTVGARRRAATAAVKTSL